MWRSAAEYCRKMQGGDRAAGSDEEVCGGGLGASVPDQVCCKDRAQRPRRRRV